MVSIAKGGSIVSNSNRIAMSMVYGGLWYLFIYFQLVFLSEQVNLQPLHYLLALFVVLIFSFFYQLCCFYFQWYKHAFQSFIQALGLSLLLYYFQIMGQTYFPYYSFFLNTWLYFQATFLTFKSLNKSENIE